MAKKVDKYKEDKYKDPAKMVEKTGDVKPTKAQKKTLVDRLIAKGYDPTVLDDSMLTWGDVRSHIVHLLEHGKRNA